jgi:hypothetical protein
VVVIVVVATTVVAVIALVMFFFLVMIDVDVAVVVPLSITIRSVVIMDAIHGVITRSGILEGQTRAPTKESRWEEHGIRHAVIERVCGRNQAISSSISVALINGEPSERSVVLSFGRHSN